MPSDDANVRRPTLTEVAALAGVSLKTASRALNREPNVAPSTGRRVRDAADVLGYRLNGIARELRRGATSALVGLVSGDLANPFYSAVASGIERELRQHGLLLITANNDEDAELERSLVDAFLERRVRALLAGAAGQHAGGHQDRGRVAEVVSGPHLRSPIQPRSPREMSRMNTPAPPPMSVMVQKAPGRSASVSEAV